MKNKDEEFELRHKVLRLETLYDIGLAIHAIKEVESLAGEILSKAISLTDARGGFLLILSADESAVEYATAIGFPAESIYRQGFLKRFDPARKVMDSGEAAGFDGVPPGEYSPPLEALVLLPLIFNNRRLGLLGVIDKEKPGGGRSGFDDHDWKFLNAVANQAAVAMDNVRMYEEMKVLTEKLRAENISFRESVVQELQTCRMIGNSQAMMEIYDIVDRVTGSNVNVLIIGESGTGKELIAKSIHYASPRMEKPFVVVNSAALPESLLETELFGIEKGVATGVEGRQGKFELCDGGTLFLDEIGDMSFHLQAKLLRAIQERAFERVGGRRLIKVDIRIVAATNRDLAQLVREKKFREDLYYRLKVIEIRVPPLRERMEDVPGLASYFLKKCLPQAAKVVTGLSPEAMAVLTGYEWPGNVRELENTIEGAVALSRGPVIEKRDVEMLLGRRGRAGEPLPAAGPLDTDSLEKMEREHIIRVLEEAKGNQSVASKLLGIDRKTLYRKRKKYGLL
jgi:transcriptional regulator with GAF, ATPase, and Fis domain